MVAAALCLVVLAAVSSVVVGSAPSYQRLAKPRQPRSSLQQRGRGLLTRPTPNNAKRTKNRGGKKKQQIVSIELSTSGGITTREAQLFEPHPNTHSGYREGDVYCTLAFEKSPRLDADAVQQPAEFFLASFSVDNQTWDPTLNRSTRVFLSPEFNAMLLYRPGMKYHGGAQSRRVSGPVAFWLSANGRRRGLQLIVSSLVIPVQLPMPPCFHTHRSRGHFLYLHRWSQILANLRTRSENSS